MTDPTSALSPEDRATIRARAEAATPGPWVLADRMDETSDWYDDYDGPMVVTDDSEPYAYSAICKDFWESEQGVANARFIAAARTHVPRLLDALDTAEAEIERLRRERNDAREGWEYANILLEEEREHLPTRPDRDTISDVLLECGTWCGMADVDHEAGPCPACVERARGAAHAVLLGWPGRSEAEVKAEALREAADEVERIDPAWDSALWIADPKSDRGGAYHPVESWLRDRADHIEGGADRG